jgi:hypothetical protein
MFSEWDFNSSSGSLVAVLFMGGIMIGFGALLYWLLAWIFGKDRDAVSMPHVSTDRREPPFRKAA